MRHFLRLLSPGALLILAGCVHQPSSDTADLASIGYSAGPCYGTCPVYSVEVDTDGAGRFTGEAHTALIGQRELERNDSRFARLEAQLAEWRPAMGATIETPDCGPRVTDHPRYTVTWTRPDGEQAVLEHDSGCRGPRARELTRTLASLPDLLGIERWIEASSTGDRKMAGKNRAAD